MNRHVDIDTMLDIKTGLILITRWIFEDHKIVYHNTKVYNVAKYPQVVRYFAGEKMRPSGTIIKHKIIFFD